MELNNENHLAFIASSILNYLEAVLVDVECHPTLICIVGSRVKNTHSEFSDLDIAIQYKGRLKEDDACSILNNGFQIANMSVDFIPYHEEKGNQIDTSNNCIILYQTEYSGM